MGLGSWRRSAWLAAGLVASCGGGTEPKLGTVLPGAVCTQAGTATIALSGSGFAPVVRGGLADGASLAAPGVLLTRTAIITGTGTPGAGEVAIDGARVRWTDQGSLSVDLSAVPVTPGLYSVRVRNGNGEETRMDDALLVVPPPVGNLAAPYLVSQEDGGAVTVTGDFFVTQDTNPRVLPTARLALDGSAPIPVEVTSVDGCRALPGKAGLSSCQTLVLQFPPNLAAAGDYALEIVNPAPVDCNSTSQLLRAGGPLPVTIVPRPKLTSVASDVACAVDAPVTLTAAGLDILSTQEVPAMLRLGALPVPLVPTGCSEVPLDPRFLPRATPLMKCTGGTATVPAATLATGLLAPVLENAFGAGKSVEALGFYSAAAPAILGLEGGFVCASEGEGELAITGTGFLVVDEIAPTVMVGTLELPGRPLDCDAIPGVRDTVQLCARVAINVPEVGAPPAAQVIVKNPVSVGCASKELPMLVNVPAPTITEIEPTRICVSGEKPFTITGTNFLTSGALKPVVTLSGSDEPLDVEMKECLPIPASPLSGRICTEMEVTLPTDTVDENLEGYEILVTNPAPADCEASASARLQVALRPVITGTSVSSVLPGASIISITGTNFAPGAEVTVDGLIGSGGSVVSTTSAIAVVSANPAAPGNVTGIVMIDNGDGCVATSTVSIPPPLFP